MPDNVYTIGYEGRDVDQVLAILEEAGVKLLVDCRIIPCARNRPGLSKNKFSELLFERKINYVHEKDLGTPREIMKTFKDTGFYDWDAYNVFLRSQTPTLYRVSEIAKNERVCFMCFEADASICHRRFVAKEISSLTGQGIINL